MRDGRTMNEQKKVELLNLESFATFLYFGPIFMFYFLYLNLYLYLEESYQGPDCCFVSGSAELNFSEVGDRQVVWDNRTTQIL